ncbi:KR-domain-containing protein [Aspergillus californicus]
MGYAEAASLPTSFWVAYRIVYELAHVQAEDTVLIFRASSCIGQMAVQLVIQLGARAIAVVGPGSGFSERRELHRALCIPTAYILADDASLGVRIQHITNGRGVDVVLGPMTGEEQHDLSSYLATYSRRRSHSLPLARTLQDAMRLYMDSSIHLEPPQPLQIFAAGDYEAAFHSFCDRDSIGKRVIELHEGIQLQVDCIPRPAYTFAANACYLTAGGLGGLGRCIARWMVRRGACHLILLSRQSADPKVKGSWSLRLALPSPLDFFILLSSLNGIYGNRSQANYAAGNSFIDALERYRLSQGQKAVAFDLGMIISDGAVAEDESLLASLHRMSHLMEIKQAEFLALLDYYCNPNLPVLSLDDAQVLVGIETLAAVLAKGLDLHHSIRRLMFSHMFHMTSHRLISDLVHDMDTNINRPAALKAASPDEANALVLSVSPSDIEPDRPIRTYGIDSLVAVDLKNWFETAIGAEVTVFDLMGNVPLRDLCTAAAQSSRYCCC